MKLHWRRYGKEYRWGVGSRNLVIKRVPGSMWTYGIKVEVEGDSLAYFGRSNTLAEAKQCAEQLFTNSIKEAKA